MPKTVFTPGGCNAGVRCLWLFHVGIGLQRWAVLLNHLLAPSFVIFVLLVILRTACLTGAKRLTLVVVESSRTEVGMLATLGTHDHLVKKDKTQKHLVTDITHTANKLLTEMNRNTIHRTQFLTPKPSITRIVGRGSHGDVLGVCLKTKMKKEKQDEPEEDS